MNELERARRYKKTWNRFLEAERRALEHRRDGQLARLLGGVSPTSESAAWELAWLEQEDRGSAEEGLVELRRADGEIEYKHIDDLSLRDWDARVEAERLRVAWIANAQRSGLFSGGAKKEEIEGFGGSAQDGKGQSAGLPPETLARADTVVDAPGASVLRLRDVGADSEALRPGSRDHGHGIPHAEADGEGRPGKVFVGTFEKRAGSQGVRDH
jgi:hypothetical protein